MKMVVKTGASWSVQCFRMEDTTPSGPAALQLFCFPKSYLTPCSSAMKGGGRVAVLDGEAVMVKSVNNSTMANTQFLVLFVTISVFSVASISHEWPWNCTLKSLSMKTSCCTCSRSPPFPPPTSLMQSKGRARAHTAWHQ